MKEKNDVKVMLKEAGILFAITLLAGLLLGFVYEVTKEPRKQQQEKMIQDACVAVFPEAVSKDANLQFEVIEYTPGMELQEELLQNAVSIGKVYTAKDVSRDSTLYGYVVEAISGKGYGGRIVLYVGVAADGTVCGVSITEISETPGLGMEASNVLVPQFAGKQVEKFVYTKTGASSENEVDAITSATITTKAVTNAVNGGLAAATELLKGGSENE